MGPSLANSLHVATGIGVDTPLGNTRQQRVPFNLLSRNLQLMHRRGVQILSVRALGADTATAEVQPTPSAEATSPTKETTTRRRRRTKK